MSVVVGLQSLVVGSRAAGLQGAGLQLCALVDARRVVWCGVVLACWAGLGWCVVRRWVDHGRGV